jgi:hypothetical protein
MTWTITSRGKELYNKPDMPFVKDVEHTQYGTKNITQKLESGFNSIHILVKYIIVRIPFI